MLGDENAGSSLQRRNPGKPAFSLLMLLEGCRKCGAAQTRMKQAAEKGFGVRL